MKPEKTATRTRAPDTRKNLQARSFRAELRNRAMARKLASGACIDLKDCPRTATGDYLVIAATFRADRDYCDSSREVWIWSIALVKRPLPSKMADGTTRVIAPNSYLASPTARFHDIDTAAIECVWLR